MLIISNKQQACKKTSYSVTYPMEFHVCGPGSPLGYCFVRYPSRHRVVGHDRCWSVLRVPKDLERVAHRCTKLASCQRTSSRASRKDGGEGAPCRSRLSYFKKECVDGLPVHVRLAVKQKLSSPNTALLFFSLDDDERSAYVETCCPRAAVLQEGDYTTPN